jgi:hypothetical protein
LPNQPDLRIESKDSAALPASAPFLVKEIRIVGNTAFDTATLHALVADQQGKTLTLVELRCLGRTHQYVLPAAWLPFGAGHYSCANHCRGGRDPGGRGPLWIRQFLQWQPGQYRVAGIHPVTAAEGQPVSRRSWTVPRCCCPMPGVGVNAVLKPGEAVGTSDLDVDATHKEVGAGSISIDNYGNRYIGRAASAVRPVCSTRFVTVMSCRPTWSVRANTWPTGASVTTRCSTARARAPVLLTRRCITSWAATSMRWMPTATPW